MTWNERLIAGAIARQTLASRCVVLVDRCNWTGHECDVLGVTTNLRIIDIEIKVSRADLKADAGKEKWWHHYMSCYDAATGLLRRPESQRCQWPPRVWKHYFAVPMDIWKPELVECLPSASSGVLLLNKINDQISVTCWRRATPSPDAQRLTAKQVMAIARLANLRMWNAYREKEGRA
jgi:hypothetical protein